MLIVLALLTWTLISFLVAYVLALDGVVKPNWWQSILLAPAGLIAMIWFRIAGEQEW